MPYRNALRDNWQRFNDANDAEMRMYARERAMSQPQGMYAANGGLSMDDIGYDAQGNLVILSEQVDPNMYAGRRAMPQRPVQAAVLPQDDTSLSNIERNRAALAAALREY